MMAAANPQGMDTDIDWRSFLDDRYIEVPLHALRYTSTRRIAVFLNQPQVMDNDIIPDFGGLAEIVGFDGIEIKDFERMNNPGKAVLDEWMKRQEFEPTLGHLVQVLAMLGREDILTDCQNLIAEDARIFVEKPDKFLKNELPLQENTVSQGPGSDEVPELVTRDDVMRGEKTNYDAFVCFNAFGESGKDFEFVKELITRFENPPYNFKLFVPHRDDLAGLAKHNITATIISERCRRMIVVLSNNFRESPACTFQSTFAHSLSPGAQNRRIIPVLIEEMSEMPNIMRILSPCDFSKKFLWDWSWGRLADSIRVPLSLEDYQVRQSVPMEGFLPPVSADLSSNFLSVETSYSPSSSADSGCWSRNLTSPSSSEISTSSQPSTGATHRHSSGGPSRTEPVASFSRESQVRREPATATTTSDNPRPSSPSLGSRALRKIKQTFSSDKRKSGPHPSI